MKRARDTKRPETSHRRYAHEHEDPDRVRERPGNRPPRILRRPARVRR